MAFSIKDFSTNISNKGVLHTNAFDVSFSIPTILQNKSFNGTYLSDIPSLISFRAESARLPGVALAMADVNRYGIGVMEKMPYNAQFTDTSITFIADKQSSLYQVFYLWMNSIYGFTYTGNSSTLPTFNTEYKDNYTVDITLNLYNGSTNNSTPIQTTRLLKAYPIYINEVNLDWAQQNQLFKFTVGFSFRNWTMDNVSLS